MGKEEDDDLEVERRGRGVDEVEERKQVEKQNKEKNEISSWINNWFLTPSHSWWLY